MTSKLSLALVSAVALLGMASIAHAGPEAHNAGQKLDSGLGELLHYSKWIDKSGRNPMARVAGESLDSGLGELPHYSQWVDKSGRDPLGHATQVASLARKR